MKLISLFAVALAAGATAYETNGARFARGLPPNPPQRRDGTPSYAAKKSHPSATTLCPSGASSYCCESTGYSNNDIFNLILGLLDIVIDDVDELLGLTCADLVNHSCPSAKPHSLCCNKNHNDGALTSGCSTCPL